MRTQSLPSHGAVPPAVGLMFLFASIPAPLTAQESDELEEVVVTGSFIARPADRPQPVTVIDNSELINQSRGSLAEVFKDLPIVSGTVATINWSEGQDSPTNTVNLRGLGARATLVLLNSKRQTIDGSSNSQGFSAVDINNLAPPIMIERIEVLGDGASALYGSDAVAGVVNFITRNDFEGAELRVNTLWNEDADSGTPEFNVSGLFGTQGDTTGIVAGFEYASTEQVQSDHRYDTERLKLSLISAFGNPGNFQPATPTGSPAGGPFPDPLCGDPSIAVSDNGVEHGFRVGPLCRMALAYGRSLVPDSQRFNGLAVVTHDFGNEVIAQVETGFARTRYSNNFGHGLPIVAPPRPFVPRTNPGVIAANAADPNFAVRDYIVWFREKSGAYEDPAPQTFEQDTYRLAASLEGPLGDSGWDWTLSGTYSTNDSRFVDVEAIRARLDLALRGLGGRACNPVTGTPGEGNCQYWNPFANRMLASPGDAHFNDPDVLDWFSAGRSIDGGADLTTFDVVLTSGELWEMAGGPTGLAVGAQWRSQDYFNDRDDISEGGGWAFNTQALGDFGGNRETDALFAEMVMYPSDWAEVQLAARYENSGAHDSVEPKVGVLLTPSEGLFIRGTWGTSFRQASEAQSFGQTAVGGSALFIGGDQINARAQATGNPNLAPETSQNFTAGITWDITDRFTLDLNYYTVEFEDLIVPESASAVLNADLADGFITDPRIVLPAGAPTEVCEVSRSNQTPVPNPRTHPDECLSGFDVLLYDLSYINQDFWKTSGIDFGLSFNTQAASGAQWGVALNGGYILEYDITSEGRLFDGVGSHNGANQGVPMPEVRGNLIFDWERQNHYFRGTVRYISALEEDNPNNTMTEERAFTTLDVLYDYTLPGGNGSRTLTLSVQNLTNEVDPLKHGNLSTSTSMIYDVRGRRVGLAWRQSF